MYTLDALTPNCAHGQAKPYGPAPPADDASGIKKLAIGLVLPTQAHIIEEDRLRRQQIDEIRDKIEQIEQYQSRSFTVVTHEKGEIQVMASSADQRANWIETMQDLLAEAELAAQLAAVDDDDGDADDDADDDGGGAEEGAGVDLNQPLTRWLQQNGLSDTHEVITEYLGDVPLTEFQNLSRRDFDKLGMLEELTDVELRALELALSWPELPRRQAPPAKSPKHRVEVQIQITPVAALAEDGDATLSVGCDRTLAQTLLGRIENHGASDASPLLPAAYMPLWKDAVWIQGFGPDDAVSGDDEPKGGGQEQTSVDDKARLGREPTARPLPDREEFMAGKLAAFAAANADAAVPEGEEAPAFDQAAADVEYEAEVARVELDNATLTVPEPEPEPEAEAESATDTALEPEPEIQQLGTWTITMWLPGEVIDYSADTPQGQQLREAITE
jgi:hypothetical protein